MSHWNFVEVGLCSLFHSAGDLGPVFTQTAERWSMLDWLELRPDVNVITCCGGVISKYHDIYLIEQHTNGDSVPGLDPVSVSLRLCVSVDPMTAPDSPRRTGEYDGFLIWSPNVRATSSAFSQFALTPNWEKILQLTSVPVVVRVRLRPSRSLCKDRQKNEIKDSDRLSHSFHDTSPWYFPSKLLRFYLIPSSANSDATVWPSARPSVFAPPARWRKIL